MKNIPKEGDKVTVMNNEFPVTVVGHFTAVIVEWRDNNDIYHQMSFNVEALSEFKEVAEG